MPYIGNERQVALYDSYTRDQVDGMLDSYVRKDDIFFSDQPIGDIGAPGTYGFGVGVYDNESELTAFGLSALFANKEVTSDNFGNYIHTNGSVMVFVPKFYYRIGHESATQYDVYGANSVEIRGIRYYTNESEANADGFILHRVFIDGGQEKKGFFYDKYYASQSASNSNVAVSVKNGIPISLTTSTSYTRSSTMTGCIGDLNDSVILSRNRGYGYNTTTVFMRSALAMLSLCQAQNAKSSAICGWYDSSGTINYPKGANNNSLGDINDPHVAFLSAGDSGASAKPRTGSGAPFNKTTHNGQNCGIADINGAMWEVNIGITQPGSSGTAGGTGVGNTIYLLKETEVHADLTEGWNGPTDIWGNTTHLNTKYDSISAPINLSGRGEWISWGNGSEPVFFTDPSGLNRALCGIIPPSDNSLSSGGINSLGNDGVYRYVRENLYVISGGSWHGGFRAGAFSRNFVSWRSRSIGLSGFRSALYVS